MNRIDILRKHQSQWPDAHLILPIAGSHGNLVIVDEKYVVPDEPEVEVLIHWRKWYHTFTMPGYRPDKFDCDDYAIESYRDVRSAFSGDGVLAYGVCHVKGHILNYMLTQHGAWMYDYQKDRLWKATEADQPYFWMI